MTILQTRFGNDVKEPWEDICCESCWNATKDKCTCHCGGLYHGLGLKAEESPDRVMPFEAIRKYVEQIKDFRCRWCGADLEDEPVHGYDHSDGWSVEGFQEKQWLFIVCPQCRYEWSIWKLGVGRASLP